MKKFAFIFVVFQLVFFKAVIAQGQQNDLPLPPHPITIFYKDGEALKPIVGVSGKKPQIEVNGKKQTVPPNKSYGFARAPRYAPGEIALTRVLAEWNFNQQGDFNNIRQVGPPVDLGVTLSADITPTLSYKNCYFVLMIEDPMHWFKEDESQYVTYFFKHIDNLVAGKKSEIMIDLDADQLPKGFHSRPVYFFLFFSNGQQIESNQKNVSLAFFRRDEIHEHRRRLEKYFKENASINHPVENFSVFPPSFPDDVAITRFPKSIEVNCAVSVDGLVEKYELPDNLDETVSQELRRAVGGWLFLPTLVAGVPQRTEIKVPVALHD